MKFYDLLRVIENLENDDIRQTAASELEKLNNYNRKIEECDEVVRKYLEEQEIEKI